MGISKVTSEKHIILDSYGTTSYDGLDAFSIAPLVTNFCMLISLKGPKGTFLDVAIRAWYRILTIRECTQ
jgi:hypothetical protein